VAELLKKGTCVACHGDNFSKPIDPSYPKIAGQHADYLFVALKAYKTEGHATWGRSNAIMGGMAKQGLYEYDAVSRLRDSQLADVDGGERVKDIHNYIVKGVLWQAFTADQPVALLIDEIDKADIEFPNDLLREIDRMEFYCYETRELIKAKHRPLVFITSNNEKELPDAFLRRCFFHYIKFPDATTMTQIVDVHFPGLKKELLTAAMKTFYDVRNLPGLKKKPSTSELLDWLKLLVAEDISLAALHSQDDKVAVPPLVGALLKNEQDVTLFEKLVFMNQRNR
jgi:MoxR-like ATPase